MKLRAIHLFMILILSLLLCSCLGGLSGCIKEGMKSGLSTTTKQVETGTYIGPAGDTVHTYSTDTSNSNIGGDPNTWTPQSDSNIGGDPNTWTPQTNSVTVTRVSNNGIPASQIPPGDEDLYILKSQIVPPVCPACPSNASCPRQEPPPPCPPCARCPEPAFECKKVPNYRANDPSVLPRPVLSDFSQFGM